jgi:uncharacterized Fe-S cluster-containing radical SAM superfamily protein
MTQTIDTATFAPTMRERIIRPSSQEILVARLAGSDQEHDLTLPANCAGLGRIRHFVRSTSTGWPENSLPIDPASKALGLPRSDKIQAQVFQNAACAWRCWYCYVPFNLLSGDASRGEWVTAEKLVQLYAEEENRPPIIDLSGGSPDLTPEWIPWMMRSLERAHLSDTTYLWSDDNLSTDYLFTKLQDPDRRLIVGYRNYGRVCCIKGFDAASFAFNTTADPSGYDRQFEILRRYIGLGIDIYGYVTLTGNDLSSIDAGVCDLFDRLCSVHESFPLRVVPLKIGYYTPTATRSKASDRRFAIAEAVQSAAIECWNFQLQRRYSLVERKLDISDVKL